MADNSLYPFMINPGGSDQYAPMGGTLIVTDLIRGLDYQVQVVDFFIDSLNNGIVYFDGMEMFRQSNIESYEILERLFYAQYSVSQ